MKGRVLVVEEHGLVAMGVQLALARRSWMVETNSGLDHLDVIAQLSSFRPQCVLLDIHLSSGMESALALVRQMTSAGTHVVMLTAEQRRLVLAKCLEAGADGWVSTNATVDEVHSALTDILAGRTIVGRTERTALLHELHLEREAVMREQTVFSELTTREALVLSELTEGLSAEEIACAHFVGVATVRSQIQSVLNKLGVKSQLAAVAIASPRRDLLPPTGSAEHDRRRVHHPRDLVSSPASRR